MNEWEALVPGLRAFRAGAAPARYVRPWVGGAPFGFRVYRNPIAPTPFRAPYGDCLSYKSLKDLEAGRSFGSGSASDLAYDVLGATGSGLGDAAAPKLILNSERCLRCCCLQFKSP